MAHHSHIEVPIILRRPFLATGRALIDVQEGELTIRVNDQQVKFNVFNALKYPNKLELCQFVEDINCDSCISTEAESNGLVAFVDK